MLHTRGARVRDRRDGEIFYVLDGPEEKTKELASKAEFQTMCYLVASTWKVGTYYWVPADVLEPAPKRWYSLW